MGRATRLTRRGRCACVAAIAASLAAAIGSPRVALPRTAVAAVHATTTASANTPLDRYLSDLRSLRTDFTQHVTDAHGKLVSSGHGSLVVERPDRFRWDYEPGAGSAAAGNTAAAGGADTQDGQLLVADGRNLWFYDRELAQVTVKPIGAALSATPIMLLSGRLSELRASFQISSDGAKDGLDWVLVRPLSDQADFSDARLGFRGAELVRMVFQDKLGQSVQLDFLQAARNVPIDPTVFRFQVPPGVDVIGTPEH